MKANFSIGILALLLFFLLVGCGPIATAIPPTAAPPVAVPPTATPRPVPPTLPPPTATAILPTFTATSNPHVVGADCGACHIEEHKRWSLTLHAADPAAVLTNEEHNKTELLTDECIT